MKEYGYSYKQDSSYEAAQKKLTIIKHLDIDSIDRLFNITEIISHEKQGRRY